MLRHRPSVFCAAAGFLLAAGGWARAEAAPAEWHPPLLVNAANQPTNPNRPYWVDESIEPTGRAHITRMVEGKAEVVMLDGGLYQGFRTGVVCTVRHDGAPVAQLIIVASEEHRAAALITAQPETVIIMPGDEVRVSTL